MRPGRKGIHLGVYSCNTTLASLDKRGREARLLRQVRTDLINHIGGNPSPVQRMLIERCAMLQLRVAMLDGRVLDGTFTEYDAKTYLAFSYSLRRSLVALGLEPATAQASDPMTALRDHLRLGADAA